MSLEDEVSDVVGKALQGLELEVADVAGKAGVSKDSIDRILDGEVDEAALRKIAPILGLDGDALVALPGYSPDVREPEGVRRIELPFHNWTVNAWLVESEGTVLLFDTGWGKTDILKEVSPDAPDVIFITHAHPDHIGGMEAMAAGGARVVRETEALDEVSFRIGPFEITAVDLSGHYAPAAGYFIKGLETQLLVAGDAIFAGSAGGCGNPRKFRQAFETLGKAIARAEEGCLILPGHGPITSVASEMVSNPFKLHFT